MSARIVAGKIALARIDKRQPRLTGGLHADFRAVSIAAALSVEGLQPQPMTARRRDIAQDSGWSGNLGQHQVKSAVVIEIGDRQGAGDLGWAAQGRIGLGAVAEYALAGIAKE